MFSLNIIAQFFVAQGIIVTATRVAFAYARDGALPFSKKISYVNQRTFTPIYATWAILFISALLALLIFASPAAIGAVFSIGAIAQYVAFTIPIGLKVFNYSSTAYAPWQKTSDFLHECLMLNKGQVKFLFLHILIAIGKSLTWTITKQYIHV